ncbi:hypothetical protein HPB47_024035 [Ixodes persulcatus]|uniref:Uncharacterized protein n=1 Tax=Ixodes persulcatus TaxID=34615 RepID=A0AC60Q5D8_IXOPE|nr:hypothetical protein HPB47_024035 [Ixodes persulcatus]
MSEDDGFSKETLVVVRRDESPPPIQPPSEFLQRVQAGGVDYVLLTTALEEDTYMLMLTDGSRCFKGDANASRQHVQVRSLTRSALTTGTGARFEYSVDVVDDETLRFSWKQILDDQRGGPRRKLGSVELLHVHEDANRSVMAVFAGAVRAVQDAEARLARTKGQLDRLRRDHDRALDQLDRCARAKENMESELYSKFMLVLNSKKRRIAELLGEQTTGSGDEPMAGSEDEPVVRQAASRETEKSVAKPAAKRMASRQTGKATAKRVARQTTSSARDDGSESVDEPMTGSEDEQATSKQKGKSVVESPTKRMTNRQIRRSAANPAMEQTTHSRHASHNVSSVAEPVVQQAVGRQTEKSVVDTRTTGRRIGRSAAEHVAGQATRRDSSVAEPSSSVHALIESLI